MVDRFRAAKRVLDSTPLYDAVAAQDTVTLIRSAIRQLLTVAVGRGLAEADETYTWRTTSAA